MRTVYMDKETRAICDVSLTTLPSGQQSYEVNRINVPAPRRGHGHASRLMRNVITDADADGAMLHLWIVPSGDLGYEQLAAWYSRLGFQPSSAHGDIVWIRYPKEAT